MEHTDLMKVHGVGPTVLMYHVMEINDTPYDKLASRT
jgi:hypothetical protein